MRSFLTSTLMVLGVSATINAQATAVVNQGNERGVGNVRWHKVEKIDINQVIAKSMPDNVASLIFLRQADNDVLQTSANLGINGRFQVSLQPGNYSQIYACAGVNQIGGNITYHKDNDLLRNATTFKLEPSTTYFFDVDVNTQGETSIHRITQDKAMTLLGNMGYQTHQITRVLPHCPTASALVTALPTTVIAPPN